MKNIDKKELHSIFTNLRIDKEKSFNELYEKYSKLIYNIASANSLSNLVSSHPQL